LKDKEEEKEETFIDFMTQNQAWWTHTQIINLFLQ